MPEVSVCEPEPMAAPPKRTIPAEVIYRGGGKPGRRCRPAPVILRDMRAVYAQPKERDATPGQRALRRLFEADSTAFLKELAAMERAHSSGVATTPFDDARQSPAMPNPTAA